MNAISDTVQTLAVVALFAEGPTTIRNVAHIRHKETDRIAAVATELRKLGADVDERDDGLTIQPGTLHGADDRHLQRSPHGDELRAGRAASSRACGSTTRGARRRRIRSSSTIWQRLRGERVVTRSEYRMRDARRTSAARSTRLTRPSRHVGRQADAAGAGGLQ